MKEWRLKTDKSNLILATAILFFVLSCFTVINSSLNNSQSEGVFMPEIRLNGEYKVGEDDWQPIVEGKHIPATKGNVMLRGTLEFGNFKKGEVYGVLSPGTLVSLNLNHINFSVTDEGKTIYVSDTENPFIGEDACGHVWQNFKYNGEDGYIEITIRNSHKFGNEMAIDELLASMNVSIGGYYEKMALSSGQSERLIAIIVIITAFIVLGIAIFSRLLYKAIFRKTLMSGLLILSAGIYFLFTSKAFYLWSDTVIVNTIIEGLSEMAYLMFALILISDIFTNKVAKIARLITLIYCIFISTITCISFSDKIYFYDMLSLWAVIASATSLILIVLSLVTAAKSAGKQKILPILIGVGFAAFLADAVAEYFGLWQTGLTSKIYFIAGFIISLISSLRIVPENIKAAKKAEELEIEKLTLDAELAKSRISTLMSQIHPHFIYNTLGSIEQLCELDPPKAAKLVNNFSRYLRGNFGEIDNPKMIPVSKELEHTEYYISIEKVRFPDIMFITEVTCNDFSIPALTIQPIVENAVKHGILKRNEGGTIKVKVYENDASYFVSVKDNGVGFDVAELEQKDHIGLRNIRSRLDAMCGGMLLIESIIGVGTKITVKIPKEAN